MRLLISVAWRLSCVRTRRWERVIIFPFLFVAVFWADTVLKRASENLDEEARRKAIEDAINEELAEKGLKL